MDPVEGFPEGFPHEAVTLPGGGRMPLLGFGTWQLRDDAAREAVSCALRVGYRHLDTATMYGNEREVGEAVAASGIAREQLFITTKAQPDSQGSERQVLTQSLDLLGQEQIDLWLIHWPPSDAASMWCAFLELRDAGLVADVGVSNFSLTQLDRLAEDTGVMPAVNQVPWSPLLFDRSVLDGHRTRGVALEGYSALRGGALDHPVIVEMAQHLGRTAAQVIVRWHIQHGVAVIPKSASPARIAANCAVSGFALDDEQMAAIDALGGEQR